MGKSQELYKKAKQLIPGGTQLLSKRPEMFLPELWPAYYEKAKGCEVWDLDGNKFIDMSYMGIGSCILGYADEDVNKAVKEAIDKGSMSTLNSPEEVELAQQFLKLHPWAQMVRYARTGGEAMAVAVRIARARTQKDIVLFCGYHGWHDWYLSANLASDKALDGHLLPGLNPLGVPRQLKGTSIPFQYNDAEGFLKIIRRYKHKVGAVIIEPIRNRQPENNFLQTVRAATKDNNIVLIADEITSGFRLNQGGAHLLFKLKPEIAVFAKGISNGYPMAVIMGKSDTMKVAQETFISSTYWTERIGPVAALATLKKIKLHNVPAYLIEVGKKIKQMWRTLSANNGIDIEVSGIDPLGHFAFKHEQTQVLKTLFTQLMLQEGFLATNAFYASYAHKQEHVQKYCKAVDRSFKVIAEAIKSSSPERYLKGPVCHGGFKRLT